MKFKKGNRLSPQIEKCCLLLVGNESFVNAEKDLAIALFNDFPKKQASNFQNYLRKHRFRIPDYQLYQELGICIGSGSVESWIKQIGSRVKIVGARREASPLGQWNPKNVSQMLRLRCAYLNQDIALSICT